MTRKLTPGKLVIASHNKGKVREIAELLGPYGMDPISAGALDLPEPEETGTTFIANAILKAVQAADLSGLPALADDSGLCVDSGDAKWAADKQSTSKDRKKRSTKTAGTLSVTIDGGRGSVFLNGRFVGTAPVSGVSVPSGKNDLHVRDGEDVLANGTLTVGKGTSVSVTVRHD